MHKILSILYFFFAIAFLCSLPFSPYPGSFALKATGILLLLVAVAQAKTFPGKFWLAAAIVFSAAGDIILDLNFQGAFIAGLGCFLAAHIWYIVLFGRDVSLRRLRVAPTAIAILYPAAMAVFLWAYLGALRLPVAIYIAVIATMLVFALNRQTRGRRVIVGALLFVISDSILALNKFYYPHPAARYAIMTTYYLAQYLIVTGILKEKSQ